jgi:dTDP-4-amino-4,6-dideoxygalactose transaminase
MKKISYGSHYLDSKDHILINKVLKSNYLTNGPVTSLFETKLKKYFNTKYVISTSSGTSALDVAFGSINLKKDDIVIMPVINFIASFNMATKYGAKIYLSDVNKHTGQMEPENLLQCIKKNKLKKIKCIVTMYLGGSPENAEEFYDLKKKYNFLIIEDACHAFGSKINFKKKMINVGSNLNSDISAFSFHPVKAITTGEGGCMTTRNKSFFLKANLLKNHGIKRSKYHWDYDVLENGYNYRISDLNCALGLAQLKKISVFLKKRNLIAKRYLKRLQKNSFLSIPNYSDSHYNSFHLFIISLDFDSLKKNKNDFLKFMKKNEIICQQHYKPIDKFNIYKKNFVRDEKFLNSEHYFNNVISIPIYFDLKIRDQNKVISKILIFIDKYKKLNYKK